MVSSGSWEADGTPLSSVGIYCNVQFSVVLFVPLEEALRPKPFKLRVGVVIGGFFSHCHVFSEMVEARNLAMNVTMGSRLMQEGKLPCQTNISF